MMMRIPRAAAIVAAVVTSSLLAVGCAKKTVVGKWSGTLPVGNSGMTLPATFEFKDGGALLITATVNNLPVSLSGSWSATDTSLTQDLTQMTAAGKSTPIPAELKMKQTATLKFDKETLTLTSPNSTIVLTRVKE